MTSDDLATLAQDMDVVDPIDWGELVIREEDVYKMMAAQVIQIMNGCTDEDRIAVAMISMTKLLVENFVLNTQRIESITG